MKMGLEEELYAVFIGLREMIYIVLILAILVLIFFVLRMIEKKFQIKLRLQKKSRNLFYIKKVKKLSKSKIKPEEFLDSINDTARDFFKEAFELPYSLEYLELIDEFRKIEEKECISFCRLISEISYSGEKIEKEEIKALIKLLGKIVEKNKILSKEEKLKIEEEKRKKEKEKKKGKVSFQKYQRISN